MGKKMVSVTRILHKYTEQFYQNFSHKVLVNAQARGTYIHDVCGTLALGLPVIPDPPAEYQPYIDSFLLWFNQLVEEVWLVEPEFIDDELLFLGHPDMIVSLKPSSALALIDLKTPQAFQVIWQTQLSAYHHLAKKNGYDCDVVGTLQLSDSGGLPKFTKLENPRQHFYGGFYHALKAHQYFVNIGLTNIDD